MFGKIKPYLLQVAVVLAVLVAVKYLAPESLKSQVRI